MNKLAIVVPCYNEEEVIEDTIHKLNGVISDLIIKNKASHDSFLMLVDDGSTDRTWEIIEAEHFRNKNVRAIKLAGNVGHQNALLAGLMSVKDISDAAVSIDADLQDDINVIEQMSDLLDSGCDIVYGVRSERKTDTAFKRITAQCFYKLMKLMGIKSIYNHADFRLMSRRAVESLSFYKERNLFLRGIVPTIGFKTDCVYYERKERLAGESKYPFKKMVAFAFDGITSFSMKPMTYIMGCGIVMIFFSVIMAIYSLIRLGQGNVVKGWTSLWLAMWFIGGIITFSIGLVGEYIGKIYMEVKERPRYIIEREL